MRIYEAIFERDGVVEHTVFTGEDEDAAEQRWEDHKNSNDELLGIEDRGPFRTIDSYDEVRKEILAEGIPDEYQ